MSLEFICTNDVFHHLCLLLRIHKDKELIIELFASKNIHVTKSQIKAWSTKSGIPTPGFRPMPKEVLQSFIQACHDSKLIDS